MNRITSITLVATLFFLTVPYIVSADNIQGLTQTQTSVQYSQLIENIDASRASDDEARMKELAQLIQNKWGNANIVQYSTLVDKICYAMLFSSLGKQKKGRALVDRYALLALSHSEDMPVLVEADLVSYLTPVEHTIQLKTTLPHKEWSSYRRVRTEISLHLLGRITTLSDPNFDFSRLPVTNVSPPLGAAVDSGTSPEDVTDPMLRTEYDASIKANNVLKDRYNEQYQLKQLKETLAPIQKMYVIDLYSNSPYNLPELKTLLSKYPVSSSTRQTILATVIKNITQSQQHSPLAESK